MAPLHLGVLLAAAGSLTALVLEFRSAKAFGSRHLFARPAGSALAGARYAFTKGMAPQAKESVRRNPLSYLAGVVYHCGLFAAFALLGLRLLGLPSPRVLGCMAILGAGGGLALLGKRLFQTHLRALSCPDDFLSNLLATSFAAVAGASFWLPRIESAWMLLGIGLLLYMPIGKIRHCVFFFSTRYHSGAFFGRRGVFPPAADRA